MIVHSNTVDKEEGEPVTHTLTESSLPSCVVYMTLTEVRSVNPRSQHEDLPYYVTVRVGP